jgi:hypothetical protein
MKERKREREKERKREREKERKREREKERKKENIQCLSQRLSMYVMRQPANKNTYKATGPILDSESKLRLKTILQNISLF